MLFSESCPCAEIHNGIIKRRKVIFFISIGLSVKVKFLVCSYLFLSIVVMVCCRGWSFFFALCITIALTQLTELKPPENQQLILPYPIFAPWSESKYLTVKPGCSCPSSGISLGTRTMALPPTNGATTWPRALRSGRWSRAATQGTATCQASFIAYGRFGHCCGLHVSKAVSVLFFRSFLRSSWIMALSKTFAPIFQKFPK